MQGQRHFCKPCAYYERRKQTLTVYDATRSHWKDSCPIEERTWEEPGDEGEVFDRVEVIEWGGESIYAVSMTNRDRLRKVMKDRAKSGKGLRGTICISADFAVGGSLDDFSTRASMFGSAKCHRISAWFTLGSMYGGGDGRRFNRLVVGPYRYGKN